MFGKWDQHKNPPKSSGNGPTKPKTKTMFKKWAQKQIQTHLYKCRRKHRRAVMAVVVAVAAVVVAVVAAVAVVTAATATTTATTARLCLPLRL